MGHLSLEIANVFFFVFHTALIVFNVIGWMFRRTKRLHFYTIMITLGSWTVPGFWKGFGYCFLTDWHYDVLRGLGETGMPNSYISFLVETFSGWRPPPEPVRIATLAVTIAALMGSVYVNFVRGKAKYGEKNQ